MAKKTGIFWVFLFLFANPVFTQSNDFTYQGFKGFTKNNITLSQAAEIEENGILKLTSNTNFVIGHAFYPTPITFKKSTTPKLSSFSTAFAFAIETEKHNLGGHGLAFVISPTKDFSNAVATQYLGLLNLVTNGNSSNHLFAVEFDTVQDLNFKDISDNHVGIDIDGLTSIASVNASYFVGSTRRELGLKSGKTIQAWIDYDATANRLDVMLSFSSTKPSSPIWSVEVDLSPIFEESMYVGFSASTGVQTTDQEADEPRRPLYSCFKFLLELWYFFCF